MSAGAAIKRAKGYHRPYRPEEEGKWALPHGEFGLDVIVLVGTLRYTSHRSIPEIHQALRDRGVPITERTVTHLLQRYEELVALHLAEKPRLRERFKEQGQVILAIDGLQPDVGHEVLWVLRDCLVFRSPSGSKLAEPPVRRTWHLCFARSNKPLMFPSVELSQMGNPPFARQCKRCCRTFRISCAISITCVKRPSRCMKRIDMESAELKKHLRGVRPIERAVEHRQDTEADAIRGYCLAVRSALLR